MHSLFRSLERVIKNPYVEMTLALVIMATGIIEAGDSIFEDVTNGDVGAHHGVILLGLVHAIKSLPAILAGITLFAVAEHEEEARHHKE